jgi:hypothetical protein
MRRLAVVLAVLVFTTTACTAPQARRAHRISEVSTAGSLVGMLAAGVTAAAVPAYDTQILEAGIVFVPIAVVGALVFITTDSVANEHDTGPHLTRRERRRAEAWELTKQAASAARSADCTQVQAIDPRVRELDFEFHGVVFLRDVAIQRCLRAD